MSSMDQLQQSAVTAASTNGDTESQPHILRSGQMVIADWGWLTNLIVYLVEEFNFKSIDATQVVNVVNGSINLTPIIGAVLADSFLGSFHVVSISSLLFLLGIIVLTLTATLSYSRPHCETGSSLCHGPSKLHLAVLYSAITLASIGTGVVRFILAALGANQFDNPKDQGSFFKWFIFTIYAVGVVSSTGIVYVEDNISWGLGFGICAAFNFVGLLIFLLGNRFYRHDKPQGSPYTSLARVIVAAIRKRKLLVSSESKYYHREITDGENKDIATMPKRRFSSNQHDSSSSSNNGRHLGSNFEIPDASITIVALISSATFIALLDRFLYPQWKNLTGRLLTPLQKIETGHVFNFLSIVISAVVESKRLKTAHDNHLHSQQSGAVVPMLALWLFPQLIVVGVGEAFYFQGNASLYYQEFPDSMESTATSMISVAIGAFYVSATMVNLIRNVTGWLPDDINEGRLDNVYWTFMMLGLLNFGYSLVCAKF
ncbi:Glyceraldehyde-3-phosphate dehydrogenase-like family protein [Hibiscus syriacus]|uniref:Glyceraldehyde-3-phosphate dehydrogenase-like family protein n=1 Tax=Hibiscus syriacus TaxID=106335 RepID=A0A6A3CYI3_HIBSY|nr:Glyceraldehyde-3-phosphate dehydrogenase-like family protein [Hibiscus syriacus]